MFDEDDVKKELENESEFEQEPGLEEIDQVEDYTLDTTSERSSLMRRSYAVLIGIVVYYILYHIDPNYMFNPVDSPLFKIIAFVALIISIYTLYTSTVTQRITYKLKKTFERFKQLNGIVEYIIVIPFLMVTITVLNMFFVSFSPISGLSMEPNFHDDQAAVFSHTASRYDRFDVIIVYVPEYSEYMIKRVIGLPGETVTIDHNEIYIDGVLLTQNFIDQDTVKTYCYKSTNINYCSWNVPDDSYFVLGDNRDGQAVADNPVGYSIDSRTYGTVPSTNIYGKVWFTFKDYNLLGQE